MAKLKRTKNHFALENLSLRDQLHLTGPEIPSEFPVGGTRLQTREDFRQAYEDNRDQLTVPKSNVEWYGHDPGERCWPWWNFDRGYQQTPESQIMELHGLKLISKAERAALVHLLDGELEKLENNPAYEFRRRFSPEETKVIESWRTSPREARPGRLIEFPEADEDPDEDETD